MMRLHNLAKKLLSPPRKSPKTRHNPAGFTLANSDGRFEGLRPVQEKRL